MALSTTTSRVLYSNSTESTFAFNYYVIDASHVRAILRDSTGAETELTGTQFSVTGAGSSGGVSVTLATAMNVSSTLVLFRDVPQKQSLDLVANDALPAESLEKALDKVVMMVQRIQEQLTRSVVLRSTDSSLTMQLPLLADRTGTLLGFDSSGSIVAMSTTSINATNTVSAYIATLLDDSNASNARVTLGFDAAGHRLAVAADSTAVMNALTPSISAFGKSLLDDANASDARATLGIPVIGELVFSRFKGHGSASTMTVNFSVTDVSIGSAMTCGNDATLGCVVTISTAGVYGMAFSYKDLTASMLGVSKNQATLTDNIYAIPEAQRLIGAETAAGLFNEVAVVTRLATGDVIRPVTNGKVSGGVEAKFRICRIAD